MPVLFLSLSSTSCFISAYFAPQVTLLFIILFLHQMLWLPLVLTFIFTFASPLVFVHKHEEKQSVKSSSKAKIKIPGCSRIELLKVLFIDIVIYLVSFIVGFFCVCGLCPFLLTKKKKSLLLLYKKVQKSSCLCLILLTSVYLSLAFMPLILILITYCY